MMHIFRRRNSGTGFAAGFGTLGGGSEKAEVVGGGGCRNEGVAVDLGGVKP